MPLLMKLWHQLLASAALLPALLLIGACASCGGGGGSSSAPPTTTPSTPATPTRTGTLLNAEAAAFYPRAVRLAHQADASLNGAVIASVIAFDGGVPQGRIFVSRDDGASFALQGSVTDAGWPKGLCCGSIKELPSAVGALPAGTLVWSASIGQDTTGAPMIHPVYRSTDAGKTWTYLSRCGTGQKPRGGDGTGIWEPELFVAKDGQLVCMYSDETETGQSQVLKITSTADGLTWTAPRLLVGGGLATDRPGMAVTSQLADGSYLMSYEFCSTAGLDCRVYLKRSADGLDWGSPTDKGFEPKTADGRWFRHAPTQVWLPAQNRIALVGQILNNAAGNVDATGNGATVFISSTADGSGVWTTMAAPVQPLAPPAATNWCQNYSSPLLPTADGKQLLMLGSDFDTVNGAQVCRTRFARGNLPS